jgi:hypothetical protein
VARTWVLSGTDTPVAETPPIFAVAPETKFDPPIVTEVPPADVPEVGAMLETTGEPGSGVGVGVGVGVLVGVRVAVGVAVFVGVSVRVGVFVAVRVSVGVGVTVGVAGSIR